MDFYLLLSRLIFIIVVFIWDWMLISYFKMGILIFIDQLKKNNPFSWMNIFTLKRNVSAYELCQSMHMGLNFIFLCCKIICYLSLPFQFLIINVAWIHICVFFYSLNWTKIILDVTRYPFMHAYFSTICMLTFVRLTKATKFISINILNQKFSFFSSWIFFNYLYYIILISKHSTLLLSGGDM